MSNAQERHDRLIWHAKNIGLAIAVILIFVLLIYYVTTTYMASPGDMEEEPPSEEQPLPKANAPSEQPATPRISRDVWAGRDDKVIEIVQSTKIPGTEGTLLQLVSGYMEILKREGNFIEFEGWYAFQVREELYEAGVGFKINSERKTARWDVNLEDRTIRPLNQEAFIFSGNNDVLHY